MKYGNRIIQIVTLLILIACLAPAVQAAEPAAEPAAIRGTMNSAFTWSQLGTAVVYGPSAEDPEWNSWKVYVQPDGWACENYEMTVTDPGTGASKTLQFTIAPASEYSQGQTGAQYSETAAIRGTMNSAFYEGETVYADGITDLPVGTELNVYIKSLESTFTWSQQGKAEVSNPSAENPEWNS